MVVSFVIIVSALILFYILEVSKFRAIIRMEKKNRELFVEAIKELTEDKIKMIRSSEEREERIKDLELALKEGYGIQARVEVKEVKIDFNSYERSCIVLGIQTLISYASDVELIRSYLALLDKCYEVFIEANEVEDKNERIEFLNRSKK